MIATTNDETPYEVHSLVYQASYRIPGSWCIDYLEIGVREGDSMKAVLRNPAVRFAIGIDTWGNGAGGTGRGSADHVPVMLGPDANRVLLITGDSHVILPGLSHKFDLIYVDGDHTLEGALADCNDCLPLLHDTGIMLVDDLDHPQHTYLHAAVEQWAKDHGLTFTFHAVGYGVGEVKK